MKKCLLIILDGYGESNEEEGNAVVLSKTPNLDHFFSKNPTELIDCSGLSVGLPGGQMGNSEVGHLNMGAGRVVYQELTKISKSISDGDFFTKPAFVKAIENVKKYNSTLHIMGLTSNGGVHSSQDHYEALLELAKKNNIKKVCFHCFTDGRDTSPTSALEYIRDLSCVMAEKKTGLIASVCGRFYAMDRDNRYERIKLCYDMLVDAKAEVANNAQHLIEESYEQGITDEFITPHIIQNDDGTFNTISENDSVIFFNFRADRAREITKALTQKNFDGFVRKNNPNIFFVSMTEYESDLENISVAFEPDEIKNTLGEYLSSLGLKQLRIAETEKYAHVTYFFNGGVEAPYENEQRILVPSPKVLTYDLQPQMSAYEVCDKLEAAIKEQEYDFIAVNFANCDMVGHTGILPAAIKAVEAVDECVGKVVAAAKENSYSIVITADHGNAEKMIENNKPFTAHTTNRVKFSVYAQNVDKLAKGSLCDVAPSILDLMDINQPSEMSGRSLIIRREE